MSNTLGRTIFRQAEQRNLTGADVAFAAVTVAATVSVAHGDATGLLRRACRGRFSDAGTAGTLTSFATNGLEA